MSAEELLAEVIRSLARGDLTVRAPEGGDLPALSAALNELAAALEQREAFVVAACGAAEASLLHSDAAAVQATDARERERERFASTVRQMGLPLLEVADNVLVVPVVGMLDSGRASDLMGDVLARCHALQARFVIVDLTAIDVVDTATADALFRIVSAAGLLGTKLLFTGVRAEIARTMISFGIDLGTLRTYRTVKAALAALRPAAAA